MDVQSHKGPREPLALLSIAGGPRNSLAPFHFLAGLWSWAPRFVRAWREEQNHALAAARRYDELRSGRSADVPLHDRASKARQVFAEIYGDKTT